MKRSGNLIAAFLLRSGIGLMSVHFINTFLESAGYAISVGIGTASAVVSGILGAPGILLLYGINFCSILFQ